MTWGIMAVLGPRRPRAAVGAETGVCVSARIDPKPVVRYSGELSMKTLTLGPKLAMLIFAVALAPCTLPAQTYNELYDFGSKSGDPQHAAYSGAVAQGRD